MKSVKVSVYEEREPWDTRLWLRTTSTLKHDNIRCAAKSKPHIPEVEVFELLQAADLSWELFDLVVEHVQNFQVLQLGDVRRHSWRTPAQKTDYMQRRRHSLQAFVCAQKNNHLFHSFQNKTCWTTHNRQLLLPHVRRDVSGLTLYQMLQGEHRSYLWACCGWGPAGWCLTEWLKSHRKLY